ncbi:MAG: hypothetical protein EOP40_03395 [Rubrivivax sp.]|nr:MAG: hypothetical protein EOP40_03395 [Rubrivivax sp.]
MAFPLNSTLSVPLRGGRLALLFCACLTAWPAGLLQAQVQIQAPGQVQAALPPGTRLSLPAPRPHIEDLPQAPARAATGLSENVLPSLGDINSQTLSPAAERRLGDRIMRSILRDPDVIDDPLILEHVRTIWGSLLTSARHRGDINADIDDTYAWTPFLVRERSVNAFALPGGYIGVHLGLLAMTRSPDELSSVLAHELSHVTQRHIARMMSQSKQTSWVGLAAMVLGALAASRSSEAAQALIMGGQGVAVQGQLNFSRDMEREADRVGFGVMTEAGYAPAGMAQMFEQLQVAARLNDDNSYPYLRSHPLTTERIGEARARMGTAGWGLVDDRTEAKLDRTRLRHALMSARARVLMDTRSASLQGLVRPVTLPASATPIDRLARHYEAALAAIQLKDRAQAEASLRQAQATIAGLDDIEQGEARRVLMLAAAELDVVTGRAALAQATLADALAHTAPGQDTDHRPELLLLARATLNMPDSPAQRDALQNVVNRLQPLVSSQPQDAAAWTALSSAWARLDQPLRALRADAEASAVTGDLQGAVDRVDSARRRYRQPSPADLIELSVMDARVRAWRQTIKDDAREDKLG